MNRNGGSGASLSGVRSLVPQFAAFPWDVAVPAGLLMSAPYDLNDFIRYVEPSENRGCAPCVDIVEGVGPTLGD